MGAGNYDINAEQGSNFSLYVQYQTGTGASIDLAVYNDVRMQVRRSKSSTKKLIELNKDGVTGGGVTGDFTSVPVGSTVEAELPLLPKHLYTLLSEDRT